ncbi:hydrogenase expression/formation protein [Burkholderia vietnamiensis]|uniref:Hydrogenase 1 maturation peptidase HyaD, Aspartic peptidase, MEROPS family A31 n=1 Tax=Burkholderia vietnamiensis (strain G4 / LMG 22486) TaxID=269482 RepID=A4JRF6_BURVG|nr:HyaD/HybD family hydrogenase maturation endopeptidase [Burkholderia vietnamiensis]ABO58859.1 Hydrogenase 1 maturation peptidase HyaD, Aspartic peptidase, MEROPS family A31 [Burkholderia vietnamiensis G4]KVR64974.1 hydrogenase expression/formation protein [Burkholderia vietnamiensis]MBR8216788.1 HyaD/HybD family hydrogenase maturation endopeptidase [Burkholderia vietnamiensis]MCB4348715.1 HyaD/HybD family hydrogenase maturation endopeptidase [Burkholderia vietnamiensis]
MDTSPQTIPSAQDGAAIVALGIGNVLWADEGFGVRCIEALQQRFECAPNVTLMDGGTQGLYLIQHVQAADFLLIFDAVDYGLAPGELKIVEDDEVPKFLGVRKMSLHQTGFQEVLMLAQLTGKYPRRVVLIGCQPEEIEDYGGSLRPCVKAALERALDAGVAYLREWGGAPLPRRTALRDDEAVTLHHLALARYEDERPSEADACRIGDERVLVRALAKEPPSCA